MPRALKGLKLQQLVMIAAFLFGGIGAGYGVHASIDGSSRPATPVANEEQASISLAVIPAKIGDLSKVTSIRGSLVFPNKDTLAFGVEGIVGEVLVGEGQPVREGQPLARVDTATMAGLERSVVLARISLREAEHALTEISSPPTNLKMAEAESTLAQARVGHRSAVDGLAKLLEPTAREIAKVDVAVADSGIALSDAREALARLLEPGQKEVTQAETAVINAKISAKQASLALDRLQDGPSQEELSEIQALVDIATTTLSKVYLDFDRTKKVSDDRVREANEAADVASLAYREALEKWLGNVLTEEEADLHPDALLATWNVDLESLFNPKSRFYDLVQWPRASAGMPVDDPSTRWDESVVYIWLNFYPGRIDPTCGDDRVTGLSICVQREMIDAWGAYRGATDKAALVGYEAQEAVLNADIAVTLAREGLRSAADALAKLDERPTPLELEAGQQRLDLALATLQSAEERLSAITDPPDKHEVESSQKRVSLAQADLDEAEAKLNKIMGEPNPLETEASRTRLDLARAILERAEAELKGIKEGPDPLEVALRGIDVALARAALEGALRRFGSATIRAPWDGLVSLVNVEVGQSVGVDTPVIEIVDPSVIEVDGVVDETDAAFLREGAAALVTMDALLGQKLEGTVFKVARQATSRDGVTGYSMRVRADAPEGLALREGLSAVATVVVRRERDVLLVPLSAVFGTFEQPIVKVMNGQRVQERQVVLGATDDVWAVVAEGLSEAELVVMETNVAPGLGGGTPLRSGRLMPVALTDLDWP